MRIKYNDAKLAIKSRPKLKGDLEAIQLSGQRTDGRFVAICSDVPSTWNLLEETMPNTARAPIAWNFDELLTLPTTNKPMTDAEYAKAVGAKPKKPAGTSKSH